MNGKLIIRERFCWIQVEGPGFGVVYECLKDREVECEGLSACSRRGNNNIFPGADAVDCFTLMRIEADAILEKIEAIESSKGV